MSPIFDYECECGERANDQLVVYAGAAINCQFCGQPMKKLPGAPRINMGPVGAYGYYDETLGTYISTNKQHREEMRRQGVTPKGATPKLCD